MNVEYDEDERFESILTRSFTRMHAYTCAEASLQGLLEYWGLPVDGPSWATAGYMGAIEAGKTTCGLLAGSAAAVGFKVGQGLEGIPEVNGKARKKAIKEVKRLYKAFMEEFGCTSCKDFCGHDFSDAASAMEYLQTKAWKQSCDKGLKFVFEHLRARTEAGKI